MQSITDKIDITAGAIRSVYRLIRANSRKAFPDVQFIDHAFDTVAADQTWMELAHDDPTSIPGAFYTEATDRQAKRVLNAAVKGFKANG